MLDGVCGVIGVRGGGLPGVGGRTHRRGLIRGSDGGGGNVGEDTEVPGNESDDVEDTVVVEPPVPLLTNCLNPATGEVKRVGDVNPGVTGGEVGVGHGGTTLGS